MAHNDDRQTVKPRRAANYRVVICKSPVAMKLDKFFEESFYKIKGMRAIRVSSQLHTFKCRPHVWRSSNQIALNARFVFDLRHFPSPHSELSDAAYTLGRLLNPRGAAQQLQRGIQLGTPFDSQRRIDFHLHQNVSFD
jgi:hypothetical protein